MYRWGLYTTGKIDDRLMSDDEMIDEGMIDF